MAVADTAKLIAELGLKDKMSAGLGKAAKNLGTFEKGVGRVGKGVGQVGAGIVKSAAVIGTAATTAIGAAAKATIDWQDAFAGVVKTVDAKELKGAGLTFRDLELQLRQMATEMPNTASELAGIAEAAGALGIKAGDITAFTKQVAILAATTNVSADDAATALGQLQNVIGLTGSEFDNFAAALVDLGNKGASTEAQILEIARRSGGAAKLFGIAKDEMLGWSSAAANLGLNEELAGTALQNVFVKLLPKFIDGSKDLQKVLGKNAKQIQQSFKKDAGGALEGLLKQLGRMPKDARLKAVQSLFGKSSGITRLVLGLADSFDKNLKPSLDTSADAWHKGTAAAEEFAKRQATVKSAISRLRNGVMEAAITVGEGFVPALGEAADKLSKFLAAPENKNALTQLGKDIGEEIRKIDWDQVLDGARSFVDVLKTTLGLAKDILGVLNALPTEAKAAGLAVVGLDKISGGLFSKGLGNIVGGIGETITRALGSKIPGVGKLFAQPVFVTNWPAGMGIGGGAAGAAGAAGKGLSGLSKVFLVGEAIALVAAVNDVRQTISDESTKQAQEVHSSLNQLLADPNANRAQLQTALDGVKQGINDLQSNPLNVLVQGDALNELQAMKGALEKRLGPTAEQSPDAKDRAADAKKAITDVGLAVQRKGEQTTGSIDKMKGNLGTKLDTAKRGLDSVKGATDIAAGAVRTYGAATAAATRGVAPPIVSAIYAARPITNVDVHVNATTVTKQVSVTQSYGQTTTSRDQWWKDG